MGNKGAGGIRLRLFAALLPLFLMHAALCAEAKPHGRPLGERSRIAGHLARVREHLDETSTRDGVERELLNQARQSYADAEGVLAAGNNERAEQFAASADDLLRAIALPKRPKRPPIVTTVAGTLDRVQTTLAILTAVSRNGSPRVGELATLARHAYIRARADAAGGDDAGASLEAVRADSIARAAARVEIATQ